VDRTRRHLAIGIQYDDDVGGSAREMSDAAVEGEPLAAVRRVESFDHGGLFGARDVGRVVRAVVGHHENGVARAELVFIPWSVGRSPRLSLFAGIKTTTRRSTFVS